MPTGTFAQVSAGSVHTCGVKSDGSLACWGNNAYGQLNNIPSGTFTQVSAGEIHTCGLKIIGNLVCWGDNLDGQSSPPAGTFTQVSAGDYHTCGRQSNGSLACWGSNDHGQSTPPSGAFTQVSAGGYHTCGIKSDGSLACWGNNVFGQSSYFSLSGSLGLAGAGAVLRYQDGSDKAATADGSGNYSLTVTAGWSGTVTPSKSGYAFIPPNRTYNNILADQFSQNYLAWDFTQRIYLPLLKR